MSTIAALSTPRGNGAIGVIRLSGENAMEIAKRAFRPLKKGELPIKKPILGHLFDKKGDIDKCVLLLWEAPNSYTGEHMAEFFCHGGSVLLELALSALFAAGAVPAPAGEFTKRAFLNGKVDLAESEAIIDMINASSEAASREALSQANGALSKKIRACRSTLVELDADIMAYVDFSDEGIDEIDYNHLTESLETIRKELVALLATSERGRIVRDGAQVCILGKPNVGKSTIMNCLAGFERCIVTEQAGTTRDVVEHGISLGGLHLRLFDTAGIRNSDEEIEAMGILKSKAQAEEADIILIVLDGSAQLTGEDREIIDFCRDRNAIYLINKSDVYGNDPHRDFESIKDDTIRFSGATGDGLCELERVVKERYTPRAGETLLTSQRHVQAIISALESVGAALRGAQQNQLSDMLELDIRAAIQTLGQITGDDIVEDLINSIFSRFCVGK